MTYISGAMRARADAASGTAFHTLQVPLDRAGEWSEEAVSPRASRKHILAVVAILAGVATYVGLIELMQPAVASPALVHVAVAGIAAAALMTMAIWLLALRMLGYERDEAAGGDQDAPAANRERRPWREPALSRPELQRTSPEFREQFGTYARHAQAELMAQALDDVDGASPDDMLERLAAALKSAPPRSAANGKPAPEQRPRWPNVPVSTVVLPAAIVELGRNARACTMQLELALSSPESEPDRVTREPLLADSLPDSDAVAFNAPRVLRRPAA